MHPFLWRGGTVCILFFFSASKNCPTIFGCSSMLQGVCKYILIYFSFLLFFSFLFPLPAVFFNLQKGLSLLFFSQPGEAHLGLAESSPARREPLLSSPFALRGHLSAPAFHPLPPAFPRREREHRDGERAWSPLASLTCRAPFKQGSPLAPEP